MKRCPHPAAALITASRLHRTLTFSVGLPVLFALSGCALPDKPVHPSVYDFGPGALTATGRPTASMAPLALADVEVSTALDSTALLYRLGYADAQQPRPYAQTRWSMPPAMLFQQRLSERLAEQRTVLRAAQATLVRPDDNATPWVLRVELQEFSQLFLAPERSVGLLRLRATVTQDTATGSRVLAQRSFAVQRPAPQADAIGAVRALTLASDAVIDELQLWLADLRP